MRKIVILGSGAGGTIVANKLRHELAEEEWQITIIDNDEIHHYQPGWLFIPFGIYSPQDCMRPKRDFIPKGVDFVVDKMVGVDPEARKVKCAQGEYDYDWLVIASGCRIVPEEVEGMMEDWYGSIHTYYTLEGAQELHKKLKYFKGGKIVHNICELPYKCPVAPIEFIFMLDAYLIEKGLRDKSEIEIVTPMAGIFTKPVATKALTALARQEGIKITTNYDIAAVDPTNKNIESHKGEKVDYDLLVTIPPNFGQAYLEDSPLADPMCFVDTEHYTLKAKGQDRIYVIGDATNFGGNEQFLRDRGVRVDVLEDESMVAFFAKWKAENEAIWNGDIGLVQGD